VDLKIAGRDRSKEDPAVVATDFTNQNNRIAAPQVQLSRIVHIHEHRIAIRAR